MNEPDENVPATEAESTPAPPAPKAGVRVIGWVLALLAAAALVAAGVYAWRSVSRVRSAESELSRASRLLESAEDDLLVVDEAVQVEISAAVATQTVEAARLAAGVLADAREASEIIADVLGSLPDERVALAEAMKDSADARAEMMDIAPTILEADAKAAAAIPLADQAVAEIKAAEDLTAKAGVEFNRHTAAGVKASDEYSVQAEARLQAAQSLLTSATASFPGADFSAFSGYVAAKISLVALAKEIDALWLAGDIAGSNTKLAAYNTRDAEIVAMAQSLPASVRDPIANAYSAATADASKRYFEARERARTAGDKVSELREAAATSD